jgi:hypothetical protein
MQDGSTYVEPEEFLSHCESFVEIAYLFSTAFMSAKSGQTHALGSIGWQDPSITHTPHSEQKYR